jgi:predicted acetyltransferase
MLCLATYEDLDILANMNKMLIEDEKHDNKMNIEQLKDRMKEFISSYYNAYLFKNDNTVVGYALVDMQKNPLYIRHFFICREFRRHGYGKVALSYLLQLLGTKTVDIEVMYWNEIGLSFWKSVGFVERSIYMRLK